MSDHLPADLVTRILLRLPVVALLRCRSVSKPWRALIDSPRFIKLQIAHSAATGKNAILFISEANGHCVDTEYVNGLCLGTGITPPAKTSNTDPRGVFHLLGSCNGLLCFAHDWEKVLITNPATRTGYFMQFRLLLKSDSLKVGVYSSRDGRPKIFYNHGHGFGYDSVSDDYKVVQIVQTFNPEEKSLNSLLISYGVRSNSCVDAEFPYVLFGSRQIGVFVGGAIHWTVGRHQEMDSDNLVSEIVIVGYDLARNEFREVPQPDYTKGESFRMKVGELGRCLCIFADYEGKFVDVWMMKEYGVKESWSILFSVPHPGLCYDAINPLGFSVTGEEVLLQLDGKRFVWYDMKDPKKVAAAEEIDIHGLKGEMDAVVCFGSLVSPCVKFPPPKEDVKVDKQKKKPGRRQGKKKAQRKKKRDDFLASEFKLKL